MRTTRLVAAALACTAGLLLSRRTLAAEHPQLDRSSIPAFPGAEGGGAWTPGGRGGNVIVVTNLDDSGPGTLREAIELTGPRIVVFQTAGLITLKSPLSIKQPFISIYGQTAPGDGICVRGETDRKSVVLGRRGGVREVLI